MLMLKRLRRALLLSQADVCASTGINLARLSKAENGKLELAHVEIASLREYLDLQLSISQQHHQKMFGREVVAV